MNYTKGKWEYTDDGYVTVGEKYVHEPNNLGLTIRAGEIIPDEVLGNSQLIAAAVNGCQSVNPDNPLAVAESIKEMHEALKRIRQYHHDLSDSMIMAIDKALAKAEGK